MKPAATLPAMPMKKYLTVLSCAALMSLVPALAGGISTTFDDLTAAYAKSENAGGNGKGGGNGGGNSGGNSAGNSASKSSSGNPGGKGVGVANAGNRGGGKNKSNGKSGDSLGNTVNSVGYGVADFVGGLFGKSKSGKGKSYSASANSKSKAVKEASLKSVDVVPTANPFGKEKNLHARMANYNSLGRNWHAYEKAQNKLMVDMREFINASINFEDAVAALGVATQEMEMAKEIFAAELAGVVAYNDYSYDGKTLGELADHLAELEMIDRTGLSPAEIDALDAEIGSLTTALDSEAAKNLSDAETKAASAEETATNLEALASDEALKEVLTANATKSRLAEYGDEYVNDEMLARVKEILGVDGTYGKIDQIREAREVEALAAPEIESAIPDEPAAATEEEPSQEVSLSPDELRLSSQ